MTLRFATRAALLALVVASSMVTAAQDYGQLGARNDGGLVFGGDSVPEIVVSPSSGVAPTRVLDGASFSELVAGYAFGASFAGGVNVAVGDLTGDGVSDLVAAMGPGGGLVTVLDGRTVTPLGSGYPFGASFAGGVTVAIGDVNGDGQNDVLLGQGRGGGALLAVDGRSYGPVLIASPFGSAYSGGLNVAVGDVNGDRVEEVFVGQASGGSVALVQNGTVVLTAAAFGAANGVHVALGDVTGDGRAELIAAPGSGAGTVLVYDLTAQLVRASLTPYPGYSGGVRVAAADFSGDGRAEIITAPGPNIAPVIKVYDGDTLGVVREVPAYASTFTGGVSVAAERQPRARARFTSAAAATFPLGAPSSFAIRTAGVPPVSAISVVGSLPAGVTLTDNANGTATLSGTPAAGSAGVYAVTLRATQSGNPPVEQAFTLTVTQAPTFTSGNSATFSPGTAGSFQVTTAGHPLPSLGSTGTLPGGVTFTDNGNGTATISGAPAPGTGGTYPLSIAATNTAGTATQAFSLVVQAPPAITSAATTTFATGSPGTFAVVATGGPAPTVTVAGPLPQGVTFVASPGGGTLSGTPAAGTGGVYVLTLTAINGVGTPATQSFTLRVNQAAAITSPPVAAFVAGIPGTFNIAANGFPVPSLTLSGALPSGLVYSSAGNGTATISGTSNGQPGTYPLVLQAANGVGGVSTQNLQLTLASCANLVVQPTAGPLPPARFGVAYTATFTATNGPSPTFAVTAGSLPAGLTLGSGGGMSGTASVTGTFGFTVTATATNGCIGSATYSLVVGANTANDAFSGVGNTQLVVGGSAPSTPAVVVAGNVLSNDTGSGSLSAGPASITSTNGGQIVMAAAGTFVYSPPVGFAGPADTFTYTATDAGGGTGTAVVTINLTGVVWYVNAAGAGDGRSHSPFASMSAAAAAARTGEVIYVHSGNPAGATLLKAGQLLHGAGAAFSLGPLSVPAGAAPTLSGTVTLSSGVTVRGLAVSSGPAPAIAGSGLTGTTLLDGVSVLGGTTALSLSGINGSLTMSGGTIAGVTLGPSVDIQGGSGSITIGASISGSNGRTVQVLNRTGGTVTFAGPITDGGQGIFLNTNSGATISFSGGLALTTGIYPAFTATGGGTVTVTQDNTSVVNTIATTDGVALNVSNTSIGAAGITFRSISAGTNLPSAGNGIVLDTTGTGAGNGGLTVTGNGTATASSGGTIKNKSGADGSTTGGIGIYLRKTKQPTMNHMEVFGHTNGGVVVREAQGLLLADGSIGAAGTGVGLGEGPLVLGTPGPTGVTGFSGTAMMRNMVVSGGVEHNVAAYQHAGAWNLVVERTTADPRDCKVEANDSLTGSHGLLVVADGTSVGSLQVSGCRLRDNRDAAMHVTALGGASLATTIVNSEFGATSRGVRGVVLQNGDDAALTASITLSTFDGLPGSAVFLGQVPGTGSAQSMLRATVSDNTIYTASGALDHSVELRLSSLPGAASKSRLLMERNFGRHYGAAPAVMVHAPDAGTAPVADVTFNRNHFDMMELSPLVHGPIGLTLRNAQSAAASMCANVTSNTFHWFPIVNGTGGGISAEESAGALFTFERGTQTLATPPSTVLAANNGPYDQGPGSTTTVIGAFVVVENGSCRLPAAP